MMRECNGLDENLLQKVRGEYKPCTCGLIFNDVERMIIYPHEKIHKSEFNVIVDPVQALIVHEIDIEILCRIRCEIEIIESIKIVHVCTRYKDHRPDGKHICRCGFTFKESDTENAQ